MASRSPSTSCAPWRSAPSSPGAVRAGRRHPPAVGRPDIHAVGARCSATPPGSKVPRHRHEGIEHIYVLIGAQRDERGDYAAGAHVVNQPGSVHTVSSPEGCVVFVVWERPNTFLDETG